MAEIQLTPSIRDERGRGMEAVISRYWDIDPEIIQTMHLNTVTEDALPAIAWGWDMLGPLWETRTTDAEQRAFLLAMYELQARRGTPWSVKTAMDLLGWPNASIIEHQGALFYDGEAIHNGYWWYGTSCGEWYEWAVSLPIAHSKPFTVADIALIMEIAQFYGPIRARMIRIDLQIADISTGGGGAPSWTGPTALDRIGLWDGTTWHTRTIFSHVETGNSSVIRWRGFAMDAPDPSTITKIGLLRADGSVYAEQPISAIHKTAIVELFGIWTISW